MTDFFQSCWQWIVTNKEGIFTFFTSANFLAIISTIIALVKTIKSTNKNTIANNEVKECLTSTTTVKKDVEDIKIVSKNSQEMLDNLSEIENRIENKLNDFVDIFNTKINAMLEVQSIVYSTIKDDNMRNSVNSILVNAKYSEASVRAKLQEEIEELKAKLAEATSKITEEVTETIDKVQNVMNNGVNTNDKNETVIRRY